MRPYSSHGWTHGSGGGLLCTQLRRSGADLAWSAEDQTSGCKLLARHCWWLRSVS